MDALRQAALDEYKHVDAIIGANISADLMSGLFGGSQCNGTAVVFTIP